ncbi:MAG: vWA domain-containing protein [Alphaproteobacteria bacterium]
MSCGLGAIILVLMLVKLDTDKVSAESDRLREDLARLEATETDLAARITALLRDKAVGAEAVAARAAELARLQAELAREQDRIAASQSAARALEETITAIEIPEKPDVIETRPTGSENYIVGLRVEGARIGVLVDASASMTDEVLIDVIRRKNMADAAKQAGPKWQRTRRVVNWFLARVPERSDVQVIAFNDQARPLGAVVNGGDAAGLGRVLRDLDAVVPAGPTNLAAGLTSLAAFRPTDVYLITDGLPTAGTGGYRSLNPFSNCSALWGGATSISGACRVRLVRHTISNAGLGNARVNVVLLPIEGDPQASHEFWNWTAATDGILISPATSWP